MGGVGPAVNASAAGQGAGHSVDLEGRLEVIHSDDFVRNKSEIRYTLITDQGEELELQFDDPHPSLPNTERIRVRGERNGNVVAAESGSVQPAGAALAVPTATTKKVAVILIKFTDSDQSQSVPYTPAAAQGIAFDNTDSVANYYLENTWGQWQLEGRPEGTVFGWYTIPYAKPTTSSACNYTAYANAADAIVTSATLAAYQYKVYAFPSASCGWSGLAYLPGTRSWLNGSGMSVGVMAHELGHNFGTHHASTMNCTVGGVRRSIAEDTKNCTWSEYGDAYTVMGSAGSKRHNTMFSLGDFGLLQAANTLDVAVNANGTYTLSEAASYLPDQAQAIRIARPAINGVTKYLHLELRKPYGTFEASIPQGVYYRITPGYTARTQSWLVDGNPAAGTGFEPMQPGVPIYDPVRGVDITTQPITTVDGVMQATVSVSFRTDSTAPSQPGTPVLTVQSSSSIKLDWTPSTDDVGVAYYKIYRSTGTGTTPAYYTTVTASTLTNTGLAGNTQYNYQVEAYDGSGKFSAKSTVASATTTSSDTTPPSVPAGLSATALSSLRMALAWTASIDAGGVASYEVSRATVSVGPWTTLSAAATTTSFTDAGLAPDVRYWYRVRAKDTSNNYGGYATVDAVANVDLTPPSVPTLTATLAGSSTVNLAWGATDNFAVTSYTLYRNTVAVPLGTSTTTSYSDIGLAPDTTYSYYVVASDAAGYSTSSLVRTATTPALDDVDPTAPTNLKATVAKGKNAKVNLTWTASYDAVGVTEYQVFRTDNLPSPVVTITAGTTSGTTTSFSQSLPSSYNYTYYVVAVDAAGNVSGQSNARTIVK